VRKTLFLTLKALAIFSPGFALKPWVENASIDSGNSEGVAMFLRQLGRNSFRVASSKLIQCSQGCPERNPGLELANAFSVKNREFYRPWITGLKPRCE